MLNPVERIQRNVLATAERRLLNWICTRLPLWVTPDKLTIVGFSGALMVAAGYALSLYAAAWLWLSLAGYCVNWFGDSLDGSLARHRAIERPKYGYFLDHSVDSLANTILACGLGFSAYVRLDVALFALVGYLLMSIHTFLSARVTNEFRLSYLDAGPTELRLILMAMTSGMLILGPTPIGDGMFTPFDLFVGALGVLLLSLFIRQTAVTAAGLRRIGK